MVRLFLQQEFDQYRRDVDLLIEEKTDLGESFLNLQQSRESERLSVLEDSSHEVSAVVDHVKLTPLKRNKTRNNREIINPAFFVQ